MSVAIFDEIVDRKDTDCLKYDFAVRRGKPEGVLPLWVADMDYQTSDKILDALSDRVSHGIFGYTESRDEYFEAVSNWMKKHHGWEVKEEWLVKTPGVVFAIAMAIKGFTRPGDAVLIQQPVYYPFSEVILDNGRRVISNDLYQDEEGRYRIDFDDFERKIVENEIGLFLLCNPHNPVGRVWTEEELTRLGNICLKHGVKVVSDEIHQDFVYGDRKHIVFSTLSEAFSRITITCTSPGKTFNIAGLQDSNIFIQDPVLREIFKKQVSAAGYSQLNTFAIAAGQAAYRDGGDWYEKMLVYVEENIKFINEYIRENFPKLKVVPTEGTYLVWIDFRGLGLDEKELENLIVNKANLWLDSGAIFGKLGQGFERFNVACPRSVLKQALDQLKEAIEVNLNSGNYI